MAIVSDVEIRLRADIARLQQDMTAMRRTVDNGMSGITRSVEMAKKVFAGFGGAALIKELASQVIGAQREFDKLNASLVTATGSTAGAAQAFGALQKFAAQTPYSVSEATEAFIKLRNLGLSPSEAAMRSYGNTSAAMGKSLNQMIEAVADAATGQFERLKEFGVTAKQQGDNVFLTFQGITKKIGNNSKEIQAYLRAIGDVNFNGAMEARANTLDGAISNLGDSWQALLRKIAANGVGEAARAATTQIGAALSDLGVVLDIVSGKAEKNGKAMSDLGYFHTSLNIIFKTVGAAALVIKNQIDSVGDSITAMARAAVMAAQGDFAGAKKAWEDDSKASTERKNKTVADLKAIMNASAEKQAADAAAAKAAKGVAKDELAQYEIVLTAQQRRDKADLDSLEIRNKLDGVDQDTATNLKKLKTALDEGAISQSAYNKYVAKVNKDATMATTAYKDGAKALDLNTEAIKRRAQAQEAANKADQVALDHQKAMGGITDDDYIAQSADKSIKALERQRDALVAQQALLAKRYDTEAARAALTTQMDAKDQEIAAAKVKRDNDLDELDNKRYHDAIQHTADVIQASQDAAKAEQDRTRDMQEEVDALGLTGKALAEVTAARLREQAVVLDRKAEAAMIDEQTEALHRQADELRKQADLGLTKQRVQEQQKFWGDVESTAHEVFLSIGDSSKSLWQRMKDSAKTLFFDWLYQMTLKKWIINIGASISGDSAVAGLMNSGASSIFGGGSSAGGSSGSGGMSAMNLISMGKTIYSGFSSGITGTLGNYITTLGNTFGKSAVSAFGAGLSGGSVGAANAAAVAGELGQGTAAGSAATAGSGAVGAGTSASYAIPIAGWIAFGMSMSNKLYKQGWDANNGSVNSLGKVVNAPMFLANNILKGLGLSNSAANILAGMGPISKLFGRKNPKVESRGIEGTFDTNGFSGQNYAKIVEEGGWFRSDKRYTKTADLSSDQSAMFNDTLKAMMTAVDGFASTLGVSTNAITGYSKKINVTLTGDATKDQEAIAQVFTDMSDELSTRLVPNIMQFAKSGETASVTLQRVVTDFKAVDAVMTGMGRTFGQIGLDSIPARERLIELSGGLQAFGDQAAFFLQNFYSDADKAKMLQKPLQEQMAALGYASVTTTAQFKDAVLALDLTTEQGAKTYAGLMALAPQFKEVADYLAQAGEAAAQAAAQAAQAAQEENDRQRQAALDYVDQMGEAVQRAVEAQRDVVTKAYDKVMAGLEESITSLNTSLETTRNLSSAIKNALSATTVAGSESMARASAQQQIKAALTVAKATGVLPNADDIRDALTAVGRDSSNEFSSLADYVRDTARTLNDVAALGDITDAQVSIQEKQLAALVDQKAIATASYNAEMARLDNVLALAQQQVDAIHGVDNSVQSVLAALAGLQGALALAANPPTTSAGGGTTGMSVEDAYRTVLGRDADASGLAFWKNAFGNVVDSAELADFTKGAAPELASKANGTWTEFLAQHGAGGVARGTGADSAAILSELQNIASHTQNTAQSTGQFAQQFDNVSAGGNSLLTESVNG